MSTNIERAAEVIARKPRSSEGIAEALAAEGLLVTDEQRANEVRLIAAAKAYREMNAYYRIQSRPPERLFKALKEAEATLKELDT